MLCSGLAAAWRPCAQALPVAWCRSWMQPSDPKPPVPSFSFGVVSRGAIWRPRPMTQPSGSVLLPYANGLLELSPDLSSETNGDLFTDPQPWPNGMRGLLWVTVQWTHYGGAAWDSKADPLADQWRWTLLHNGVTVPGFKSQYANAVSNPGIGLATVDGYVYTQRYKAETDTGLPDVMPWHGHPLPPISSPCPIRMQGGDVLRIDMEWPSSYDVETRPRSFWWASAVGWMYPEGEDPC